MMNIRIDERHAYVELEVFGQYDLERMKEVLEAMRGLAARHGYFSQLEVHHGKPGNFLKAMTKVSSLGESSEDYAFMRKMRKYAVVTDNPGLVMRIAAAFSRMGNLEIMLFPMHERDRARQWIEEPVTVMHTRS